MSKFHAVVWIDHSRAEVLQFDPDEVEAQQVRAHHHATRQHHSAVRDEHEFHAAVAEALVGVTEVLITGPGSAPVDFESYCRKHRPAVLKQLAGVQKVDHPTPAQLVALARDFFLRHDRMQGVPTPT